MQQNNNVRVLLDTIVRKNAVSNKIVSVLHGRVIDLLRTERFDTHDPVPIDVTAGDCAEHSRVERIGTAEQPFSRRAASVKGCTAIVSADRSLKLAFCYAAASPFGLNQVPNFERQGVDVCVDG